MYENIAPKGCEEMRLAEALVTYLGKELKVKLYPLVLPLKAVLPAITYQQVSGSRIHTLRGDCNVAHPRYQFDCWSSLHGEAQDLAHNLEMALGNYHGTMGGTGGVVVEATVLDNKLDDYDPETERFRVIVDVFIWYEDGGG